MLWLPSALVAEGRSVAASSSLIAQSTLISAPVILVATWLYAACSTKGSLIVMVLIMMMGLIGFLARGVGVEWLANPVVPLTLLIVGSCGVIAILLPYTAESYPLRIRGRATGWIAGCSKLGGLIAQGLSVIGIVPPLGAAALAIAVPTAISVALISVFGRESRGRDLRDLERVDQRASSKSVAT
jgi:MFS transporter, putative metabolite:H+ symporter